MTKSPSLTEISKVFLKLGLTGFGGPAAHMAMMRTEVVEKRKWLSENEFLDLIGAANLIPGPNSTELAIFTGRKLQGKAGLLIAGLSFIIPAFLIVLILSFLYRRGMVFGNVQTILLGMRPAVIGIVIVAIYNFSRPIFKSKNLFIVTVLSIILLLLGIQEVIVIFSLGLFWAAFNLKSNSKLSVSAELFIFFLEVGSVLFGSGYVLLGYLQNGLVERSRFLTNTELLDAITIGQVTPGPVFTTATFVGYLADGFVGATVSTIGIFLPSFVFVALSFPFLDRLRGNKFFSNFLDGVNAASIGLMVSVLFKLSVESIVSSTTFLIAAITLALHLKFPKINSALFIIFGGLITYILF